MRGQDKATPIDVLHDDALLAIFDFCVADDESWQSLVHVCRRWRSLVFQSPRRLNLRLFCTPRTPAREALDVWPALPLVIRYHPFSGSADNVVVALEHSDRVCQIDIWHVNNSLQWDKVLAAMQVPFPELTDLRLSSRSKYKTPPVIPDSFLGGSAPRLQRFSLSGIRFPGLPNLLLSSDHLVSLILLDIPHSRYISPEAMAALLSILSSLRTLSLEFRSPQSRPDLESRGLPPPKRSILPSLNNFHFKGATEYLEALVTRIDTPQLDRMIINLFNHIDFGTPRLTQFINGTSTLRAFDKAHLQFGYGTASVTFPCRTAMSRFDVLLINILCSEPNRLLSSMEQICHSLPPISTVEDLYIKDLYLPPFWKNDAIENVNTRWLQLLLPFIATRNLYIHKESAPGIAIALQELVGVRITEVLPCLQNIFVRDLETSGPFQDNIGQFVAARRLSGHPIVISDWK